MRRLSLLFVSTVTAALLIAPGADAMIQLDRGIAGARIGNSKAEVRAALGTPRQVIRRNTDFGRSTTFTYRGALRVTFLAGAGVTLVSTKGLGDRTNKGVGVGSSEQDVLDDVPGVTCRTVEGARLCQRGAQDVGERGTVFFIQGGVVTRVDVVVLID
ncbi:MAG: hypothetical protein ABW081_09765 [Solirubrobacteraceae bacterium]